MREFTLGSTLHFDLWLKVHQGTPSEPELGGVYSFEEFRHAVQGTIQETIFSLSRYRYHDY